jgi:hypothetical protein
MNPNREEVLFALALEKPADKRSAFLDAMCEGDGRQLHDSKELHSWITAEQKKLNPDEGNKQS